MIDKIDISKIKVNPSNPRLIKDDKFDKLVQSIKDFPQMLKIRPIVVNSDMIVLGGNMRLQACKKAGLKEVYIIKADDLTEKQQQEFIIKDNIGFGEWDWDILANEWSSVDLENWGLDSWQNMDDMEEPSFNELIAEEKNKPAVIKITFADEKQLMNAENDIKKIIGKYEGSFYSVSAGEL